MSINLDLQWLTLAAAYTFVWFVIDYLDTRTLTFHVGYSCSPSTRCTLSINFDSA